MEDLGRGMRSSTGRSTVVVGALKNCFQSNNTFCFLCSLGHRNKRYTGIYVPRHKRGPGGPRRNWRGVIEKDLERMGLTWEEEAESAALIRQEWRRSVAQCVRPSGCGMNQDQGQSRIGHLNQNARKYSMVLEAYRLTALPKPPLTRGNWPLSFPKQPGTPFTESLKFLPFRPHPYFSCL